MTDKQFSLFFVSDAKQDVQDLVVCVRSCFDTAFAPQNIQILLFIKQDDPAIHEKSTAIQDVVNQLSPCNHPIISNKIENDYQAYNQLFAHARCDIFINMPKGAQMLSFGWDQQIIHANASYSNGIFCFVLNDQRGKVQPGLIAIPRIWAQAIGYYSVPMLKTEFNLLWLADMGQRLQVYQYLPDTVLRYTHEESVAKPNADIAEIEAKYFHAMEDLRVRDCKIIAQKYFTQSQISTLNLPRFADLKVQD